MGHTDGDTVSTAMGATLIRWVTRTTEGLPVTVAGVLMAVLVLIHSGWASAHSLSPPRLRNMFINGITIARLESLNMLPDTRDFVVQVYKDRALKEPLHEDQWDAIPIGFRSGSRETRGISVRIIDDGEIKEVYVCTESEDFGNGGDVMGVITRVCSYVQLFRKGDFAGAQPA